MCPYLYFVQMNPAFFFTIRAFPTAPIGLYEFETQKMPHSRGPNSGPNKLLDILTLAPIHREQRGVTDRSGERRHVRY